MEDFMITERFKKTVLKELKISDYEIKAEMQAKEVPGWDSLTHASVIAALEKEYGIRLKNKEILNCENIGELQQLVYSKL